MPIYRTLAHALRKSALALTRPHMIVGPILLAAVTAGCTHAPVAIGYPPARDLLAASEAKPRPGPEILTDPLAADRYNLAVETWGDRVRAAGLRLCRFYARSGMAINCPAR